MVDVTLQIIADLLKLLDEQPEYRVVGTHVGLYAWAKQMAPELYAQVRARIEENRWTVVGGMWASPQARSVNGIEIEGEPFLRQIMYARSFCEQEYGQEFGKKSQELWLDDLQGMGGALPQILQKMGIQRLVIHPVASSSPAIAEEPLELLWQGIDGTRIPLLILSASLFDFETFPGLWNGQFEENGAPQLLLVKPGATWPSIPGDTDQLPVWTGELTPLFDFLELHQSSGRAERDPARFLSRGGGGEVGQRARWNGGLRDAEFLNLVTSWGTEGGYPRPQLDRAWKAGFANRGETNIDLIAPAIQSLTASVDTRGIKRPVLVVSNLSHYANEAVALPLAEQERDPVAALGPEGDVMPVQVLHQNGRRHALFIAKNAPLHGYAVWDLAGTTVPPIVPVEERAVASYDSLENDVLRVELDTATGLITRIYDKDSEREILHDTFEAQIDLRNNQVKPGALIPAKCANQLQLRVAQEIVTPMLQRMEVVEGGPVRAAFRSTYRAETSKGVIIVRQTVRLTIGSGRLDFCTELTDMTERAEKKEDAEGVDRRDVREISLHARFPVAINSPHAVYEVGYGHVERPTGDNAGSVARLSNASLKKETWAKEGESAQKWVDISEGDYGVALLNAVGDGRAVHRAEGDVLSITVWPAISLGGVAGSGLHDFCYSLLPHGGDLRDGEVMENANALNSPPTATSLTGNQSGRLPIERSFFEVDNASVFIETIKRAEREDAIIVRLYEGHNTRGVVVLSCRLPVKRAVLCDLMETEIMPLAITVGDITLPVQPFEIITVKLS